MTLIDRRKLLPFLVYFTILLGFGLFSFRFLEGEQLNPYGDGGLACFRYVQNIQRMADFDFQNWSNALTFYPAPFTFAYADHGYLHSLIGLPYYLLTQDPLETYDFIFTIQLIVAIIGFYLIARRISGNLFAIVISGLYFVYLPAFISRHPHINLYGILPWFVYFVLQFYRTAKTRYVYLSALTFLLQALVSIYLQLFISVFGLLFVIVLLLVSIKKQTIRRYFNRVNVIHFVIASVFVVAVLFVVNKPYLDLRRNVDIPLKINELKWHSADVLVSYFVPNNTGDLFLKLFPQLVRKVSFEKAIFIGIAGILVLLFSFSCILWMAVHPSSLHLKTKREPFLLCLLFLFLLWIFSLGPFLQIGNLSTNFKLPYYYLYNMSFVFASIRCPARIIVFLSLPMSLLLLWWFEEIGNWKKFRLKHVILGLFAFATVFDVYAVKNNTHSKEVYDYQYIYSYIDRIPGDVLLELPSGLTCGNLRGEADSCSVTSDGYYEFMHIYHKKWTINGYGRMVPPLTRNFMRGIDRYFDRRPAVNKIVKQFDISLILIHKYRIQDQYKENYKTFLTSLRPAGKIVYEDENFFLVQVGDTPDRYTMVLE